MMTRCALPPGSSIAGRVSIYLPRRSAPLHLVHHVAIGSEVRPLSSDRSSQMDALADHFTPCPIQNELEHQTADTYGHVQPERHEAAVEALDRYLA